MTLVPIVVVWLPARAATRVFRQNRMAPSAAPTVMFTAQQLTLKIVPVSPFSGRPPSVGGLKRLSRQVPVQIGVAGSMIALAAVSL